MKKIKKCTKCHESHDINLFKITNKETNKRHTRCEDCRLEDQRIASRRHHIKVAFGITIEQYELLAKNGCNICKRTIIAKNKTRMCVDHDHETGKIRGILCNHCNRFLGAFKDRIDLIEKAIEFVRRKNAENK